MPFSVPESTLESLEWTRVMDELRTRCRTPLGLARIPVDDDQAIFESEHDAVRLRLRETTEARLLIDRGAMVPLGGSSDLRTVLARAEKGGVLEPDQLMAVRSTLDAMHATLDFFAQHGEGTPRLAELAQGIESRAELADAIHRCLDTNGEVRDAASPTLAKARREMNRLAGDLQSRIERTLQHADVRPHLSDHFYTVRNGRFVLPVRADAKGHVKGIVHDASRSGTTLYVEPDGMVESNNRHRQAELTVEREILRVLRELSAAVAADAPSLRVSLESIAQLDLAIARGQFSRDGDGIEPELGTEGVFDLPGLRHPLIASDQCVANDLCVGRGFSVLLLSGPNAGGKTVALKSVALAALMVRAGLHVLASPGARVDLVDRLLADIGDHQDIRESLSTFSAAMVNLAAILRSAGPNTLVCLDEVGVGTDPSEGAAIAQATLEVLADSGARVVTTTHYNLLKEMAEVDDRFENASVEFDPITLAPTYRVRMGMPGASSATTVAARMGMPQRVLDRAAGLLDREDRRLDQMLTELSSSRALLEAEQAAARTIRAESEQVREEYREKLARLQERRDKLFGAMRSELDESFHIAHSQVARIIADLQRQPTSRKAAAARAQLESLRESTKELDLGAGDSAEESGRGHGGIDAGGDARSAAFEPVDWPRARIGDAVLAPGGGLASLISLPDRKGRVGVQVAGVKLTISRDRIGAASGRATERGSTEPATKREQAQALPERLGGIVEADLRGLRVEEALERLDDALDLAAAQGRDEIRVIHGIGTGALRRAVRETLPRSHYVVECVEAKRDEGGAGATRAILKKD